MDCGGGVRYRDVQNKKLQWQRRSSVQSDFGPHAFCIMRVKRVERVQRVEHMKHVSEHVKHVSEHVKHVSCGKNETMPAATHVPS